MTPIGTTWIIPALRKAAAAEPESTLCMLNSGKGHRHHVTPVTSARRMPAGVVLRRLA